MLKYQYLNAGIIYLGKLFLISSGSVVVMKTCTITSFFLGDVPTLKKLNVLILIHRMFIHSFVICIETVIKYAYEMKAVYLHVCLL